jgi:IS30 family transposase
MTQLNKHLSLDDRKFIESSLKNPCSSFKSIATFLGKDSSTISKEIRKHRFSKKTGSWGRCFNACIHRISCSKEKICENPSCSKHTYCRSCPYCNRSCKDFQEQICNLLSKPPYTCNACSNRAKCTLKKSFYFADKAQEKYELLRRFSRQGINCSEEELARIDRIISPLLKQGQSIHHVCATHADSIMLDQKTIYNYVQYGLLSAEIMDLPRKVSYRPRKKKSRALKVDKACRMARKYTDFQTFMQDHPGLPVVEIDSVEGTKGGKVLLTIHFTNTQLMLAFLRDANTSRSVTDIFNALCTTLGIERFKCLFPVILTDNGSEFSNPKAIEFDADGNRRTYVFYCDPQQACQKGAAENNHEFIRRILPKSTSFNALSQEQVTCMMNHINSYGRKKLNDRSPYESFSFFYGSELLTLLDSKPIPSDEIILKPYLLKK